MLLNRAVRFGWSAVVAVVLVVGSVAPASAQEPADPNPGKVTFTGNVDLLNQYMFRGIRQNSTGVAVWPSGDLGLAVYSGEGSLKSAAINFGVWNSLHTGDTGQDSATGKLWYESDFYSTLSLGFGGGVGLGATYTAYTSANNGFSTVKELMFKLAADDSAYMGKAALKPYAVVAFEFDTAAGTGQADGGASAGKYLEVGIAPGYAGSKASLTIPVKVGMSLGDYYELNGVDNKFGYLSVAGLVTVPLGGTTSYGAWNLHFGTEFQKLGDTTTALNGGEDAQVIYSGGFGFTY
ncbi:MAG: hypothetical protein EXQ59_02225 [Acidobacteria bacterium]|nr:hypothetical protein [Acidobacteriota bacterium]